MASDACCCYLLYEVSQTQNSAICLPVVGKFVKARFVRALFLIAQVVQRSSIARVHVFNIKCLVNNLVKVILQQIFLIE